MGSKKRKLGRTTVGFSYYMGLHMGIARAIDALVEIRVGDKQAWQGNRRETGLFYVDAPDLFGGREAEGGVKGEFDLLLGGAAQFASSRLRKLLTGDPNGRCPGFRGMVTAHFDGMYSQMNPYPKRWGFRVRRTAAHWPAPGVWYPERIMILMGNVDPQDPATFHSLEAIHAMNPAHIILYLMLDPTTGRGLPRSAIDLNSFKEAADTLFNENFGLCLKWSREGSVADYVQVVLDHIGGALFQDRMTGLIRLKLIRDDYDPNNLPLYTTNSGILEIEQAEAAAKPAIVNEVIVNYRNPVSREEGSARVQNLGAMQGDEAIYTTTLDYPGIPTADLASRVGQRELRARGTGLRRFKLKMDRRGWELQPADVFRISDAPRNIANMILRVVDYEDGSTNDNAITITAVQDIYTFPLTEYTKPQPGEHIPPNTQPELARRVIYEVPYVWLRRTLTDDLFERLDPTVGFLGAGAEQPTGLHMGYRITTQREGESAFTDTGSGSFIPLGELAVFLDYFTEVAVLNLTVFTEYMEPGLCLLVNDEIIEVLTVAFDQVDLGGVPVEGSTVTITIGRGVSDTRPWQHSPGTTVWFFDESIGTDYYEYSGDETVDVKIRPWTMAGGAYPIDITPIDSLTFDYRFIRPYVPGRAEINGEPWFAVTPIVQENSPMTLSWTHRDRALQSDRLVRHEEGNVGPEPGSSYNVIVRDEGGTVVRDQQGITGTSWEYTIDMALLDFGYAGSNEDVVRTAFLELQTQRTVNGNTFNSWQSYEMAAAIRAYRYFMRVAQLSRAIAQDADYSPLEGVYVAQLARGVALDADYPSMEGVYVAHAMRAVAQTTAFPETPDRLVMERPYLDQRRAGVSTTGRHVMAVAAKPLDNIPNHYDLLTMRNPQGMTQEGEFPDIPEDVTQYGVDAAEVNWARWGIAANELSYDTPWIDVPLNSSRSGLSLNALPAGTLIAVDDEIMSITQAEDTRLQIKRGVADTIPARHSLNARVWVLQNGAQRRIGASTLYPGNAVVAVKSRPQSFAGEIFLETLATDQVHIRSRVDRPYPPGRAQVNGEPWYNGGRISEVGESLTFSWVDRNRITQATTAVGHDENSIPREAGTQYRIQFLGRPVEGVRPVLFEAIIDGLSWTLSYAQARTIGFRAAAAAQSCGASAVTATLYSVRDGLESWQGYSIPLRLPAPECTGNNGTQPPNPPFQPPSPPMPEYPMPPPPWPSPDYPMPDPPPPPPEDNGEVPPPNTNPGQDPKPVDPNLPPPPEDQERGGLWSRDWGGSWGSDDNDEEATP